MKSDLRNPKVYFRSHVRGVVFGGVVLIGVVLASVAAGRAIGEDQIANWGTWIGAFVAGIAMVASSYALVLQAKHGESASWAIALSRLGQLYDQAYQDEELAEILVESSDPDGKLASCKGSRDFSNRQIVWLGSLGLALEQIYIATNSLSYESQRVWRLYLKNQLNKPTIRAAFVRDASSSQDYHQEFWRFVRGTEHLRNGTTVYENAAVDPKYFNTDRPLSSSSGDLNPKTSVRCAKATQEDINFWQEMYLDDEVKKQMYAAPTESVMALWDYLSSRHVFTVWVDDDRVGGFTISNEKDLIATFGIVIHRRYRKKGMGDFLMNELVTEAKKLGVKTLRADVYEDNIACLRVLSRKGFRRFIWLEKNI
jgi:GNAT superfamily N-acetyltransferase